MAKKKLGARNTCPSCGEAYQDEAQFCMFCGASRPSAAKKKNRWGLKIASIVLIAALSICGVFSWRTGWGPFRPEIKIDTLSEDELTAGNFREPTEKEAKIFANYINTLERQAKARMSRDERESMNDFLVLGELLTSDTFADEETFVRAFGGEAAGRPDSDELLAAEQLTQTTPGSAHSAITAQAAGVANSEFGLSDILSAISDGLLSDEGAAEEEEEEPSRPQFSSWLSLVPEQEDGRQVCQVCGHINPASAEVCEKCGTALLPNNSVQVAPGPVSAPPGLSDDLTHSYHALTLNAFAGELFFNGYNDLAMIFCCMAEEESPGQPEVITTIANILMDQDDYENAMAVCDHAIRYNPDYEALLYSAGMCALKLDCPNRAAEYFTRALNMSDGKGPGNEGMMYVSLAWRDFSGAFLFMLEAGRDAFTGNVFHTYNLLKSREDYETLSGKIFDQLTIDQLMDFSRNRTGFNPKFDQVGVQLDMGMLGVPKTLMGWASSSGVIIDSGVAYGEIIKKMYSEEFEAMTAVFNALSGKGEPGGEPNVGALVKFGMNALNQGGSGRESAKNGPVSYAQEEFWMSVLDDYLNWHCQKAFKERDKVFEDDTFERAIKMSEEYANQNLAVMEQKLKRAEHSSPAAAMAILGDMFGSDMLPMIQDGSPTLKPDQAAIVNTTANAWMGRYAYAEETCFKKIKKLTEEYWRYHNAVLGLVGDKEIYQAHRFNQCLNAMLYSSVFVADMMVLDMGYAPLALLIADEESLMNTAPDALMPLVPNFHYTPKAAEPAPDNPGVYVPNYAALTDEALGITQEYVDECIRLQELNKTTSNRQERWNAMSEAERVQISAWRADPTLLNKTFTLRPYGLSEGVIYSYWEDLEPVQAQKTVGNLTFSSDGSVTVGNKVASISRDKKGNMSMSVNYGPGGAELKENTVTIFANVGRSIALDPTSLSKGKSPSNPDDDVYKRNNDPNDEGFDNDDDGSQQIDGDFYPGAEIKAGVFATYDMRQKKVTSGGLKANAGARIANLVGVGARVSGNVVTGLSRAEAEYIFLGKKFVVGRMDDWKVRNPNAKE